MPNKLNENVIAALEQEGGIIALEDVAAGRRWINHIYGETETYNHLQYQYWVDYFDMIAISCFKWHGLPAGIDARAMEYILWMFGNGAMFKDFDGHLFAQAMPAETVNMYYNPNEIQLYAPNGASWIRHCETWATQLENGEWLVNLPDAVICFDNLLRRNIRRYTKYYAKRIATIDRIADVNMNAQRTPYIIASSESGKGNAQKIVKKLKGNDQYLEINDALGMGEPYGVMQTVAPYVADKLLTDKKKLVDECLNLLGVDNSNTDKRERLITDEVLSNNEQTAMCRNSRLNARREFCKYVRNVFGLEIEVEWSAPHIEEPEGVMMDENAD